MQNTARYNEHNRLSRKTSHNLCKPWTRAEIEVARDRTLTVRQAAAQLGRTLNTVKHMRRPDNKRANQLLTEVNTTGQPGTTGQQ